MDGSLIVGDMYLDRLTDGGASTGYLGPMNGVKLAITHPDPDVKDRISKMQDSWGQALNSVAIPKPAEVAISIDDQPPEILALAMLGSLADINQGSGTLTDEAVTLIPDRWVPLSKRNLAEAGFNVSTVAAPSTPLVLGTDYQVNYARGLIKALSGGAIAAATACLVDATYSAVTGKRIEGGARPTAKCKVLMIGKNMATGTLVRLEIDEASLSPTGEIDFMSGEFITTELKGKLRTLPGMTSPYRYEELTPA